MLSQALLDAFNTQIMKEFYSAYLYLSMANYAEANTLPGTAKWLRAQAAEEQTHGMKLLDFVQDRGGRVTLQAIAQPPAEFKGLLPMFEQVLEHEQYVTASIHALYELALKENDYAAQILLQWFVSEQVEEEKHASTIVDQIKQVGTQSGGLFLLDAHVLGRRDD
jgi:ferritin